MARHLLTRPHHDTADRPRRDTDAERSHDADADARTGSAAAHPDPVTPYDDFRGTNRGACFFDWLVAVGVTLLLAVEH